MKITDVTAYVRADLKHTNHVWQPVGLAEWVVEAANCGVPVELLADPVPDPDDLAVVASQGQRYVLIGRGESVNIMVISALPEQQHLDELRRDAEERRRYQRRLQYEEQPPF